MVKKAEKKWWKKLVGDEKTPHYVKIDWNKWVDEDDDDDTNNLSTGVGELDDYDDDAEEITKPDEEDTEQAESGATHKIEEVN